MTRASERSPVLDQSRRAGSISGESEGSDIPLPNNEVSYRAVHKIRLSALRHNYVEVESAANRQRCSVIVVVKGMLRLLTRYVFLC